MALIEFVNLPEISDERGKLFALEQLKNVPFEIKRVYYLCNLSSNHPRGFHAHKKLKQVAICVSGSCRMILDDGMQREEIVLDPPNKAILIDNMVWHEMHGFSSDCVFLVLASEHYEEADYIRNYEEFKIEAAKSAQRMQLKNELRENRFEGKKLALRLVEQSDAEFILSLRLDENKNKFISKTDPDLQKQIEYINGKYNADDDFYFIIEGLDGTKLGTIRIYDLQPESFCWGSWMIVDGRPSGTAIESVSLILKIGFYKLGYQKTHFDVRKKNSRAISLYEYMGAIKTGETELDYLFEYPLSAYEKFISTHEAQ